MTLPEAIILGLIQGLTEFLPVSSSGHIEIGKAFFGVESHDNLMFSVIVHTATMCSILVVFRNDLFGLFREVIKFRWNYDTKYSLWLIVSAIPAGIVGVLFEDQIDQFFSGRLLLVGSMLMVTALLLFTTKAAPVRHKDVSLPIAFIIGIAQAIAILPGISRSGATIAVALLLGVDRSKATRFSFLMVLIPIAGATLLKIKDLAETPQLYQNDLIPLVVGFIVAFLSGLLACKWMISVVKKGNISWFGIYCGIVSIATIVYSIVSSN